MILVFVYVLIVFDVSFFNSFTISHSHFFLQLVHRVVAALIGSTVAIATLTFLSHVRQCSYSVEPHLKCVDTFPLFCVNLGHLRLLDWVPLNDIKLSQCSILFVLIETLFEYSYWSYTIWYHLSVVWNGKHLYSCFVNLLYLFNQMILVAIFSQTGFFDYAAVKVAIAMS